MTRVAILGDGLLGRTLFDYLAPRERGLGEPPSFAMFGHSDFDIRDQESILVAIKWLRPDVIINTVALHSLARCQDDPNLAFDINARGAGRVAHLAPTVYVSTDYVFTDKGPHEEVMPGERPPSIYGRSKFAGELETLESDGIVVRVAGLYGHYQSHKGPTFPEQVLSGYDTMRLPDDQIFSPTYAPDAAERIVDLALALADRDAHGIYHAANDGWTTWAQFAEHILIAANHKRHVIPFKAKDPLRPTNSALKSKRLPPLRHWRIALSAWAGVREKAAA